MHRFVRTAVLTTAFAVFAGLGPVARADDDGNSKGKGLTVQLGPRPYYLVEGMDPSPLKDKLMQCKDGPFRPSTFSIAHRGGALQFPEHTRVAYQGGAREGAGIVECDTTFTRDAELVCRHAENDLHTTTNILVTPLAAKCTKPFVPATYDAAGKLLTPASAECRTSDLTLAEFKTLQGKMDSFVPGARTPAEFLGGTPSWRTDLYTGRGPLMSLRDSIELNEANGVKHTPELKESVVDPATGKKRIDTVFKFPTTRTPQENYAQAFADTLSQEGVRPRDAFPQSFNANDILYWINNTKYGKQAVFLVDAVDAFNIILTDLQGNPLTTRDDQNKFFLELRKAGVQIVAPAMPTLLRVDATGQIVPSQLARDLMGMGFDIITWTFERSDLRRGAGPAGFYFSFDPNNVAIKKDSDMYKALDVLAKQVKILGIFSDWPATVTYYANCMNLGLGED